MSQPIDKITLSVKNGTGKIIPHGSTRHILINIPKSVATSSAGGTASRIAFASTDAPNSTFVDCYLDYDAIFDNIDAYGEGSGDNVDWIEVVADKTQTYKAGRTIKITGSSQGSNNKEYTVLDNIYINPNTQIAVANGTINSSASGGVVTLVPPKETTSDVITDLGDGVGEGGNDVIEIAGDLSSTYKVGRLITVSGSSEPSNNGDFTVLVVTFSTVNLYTYIEIASGSIADDSPETRGTVSTILTAVPVKGNISNGDRLDEAMPLIVDGDKLVITKINGVWYSDTTFNGAKFRS